MRVGNPGTGKEDGDRGKIFPLPKLKWTTNNTDNYKTRVLEHLLPLVSASDSQKEIIDIIGTICQAVNARVSSPLESRVL